MIARQFVTPVLIRNGTATVVPSINSSCMRLANFLQPECFGRLHVGRFKSRRRTLLRGRGVSWCEVRQPFRADRTQAARRV